MRIFKRSHNFLLILSILLLTIPHTFAINIPSPQKINNIFPDIAMAKSIKNILCKPSLDSVLTQDELNSVKIFFQPVCDRQLYKISNLEGIQYLNNLKQITIAGGKIIDINPLNGLLNLNAISLPYNKINDLTPLSKLKKLTHLDLSCNQISSLSSLYNLENLEWIEIPGNNVKDLSPLKRLRKLKTLNIMGNPADYTQLTSLKGLRIFYSDSQNINNTYLSPGSQSGFIWRLFGWS